MSNASIPPNISIQLSSISTSQQTTTTHNSNISSLGFSTRNGSEESAEQDLNYPETLDLGPPINLLANIQEDYYPRFPESCSPFRAQNSSSYDNETNSESRFFQVIERPSSPSSTTQITDLTELDHVNVTELFQSIENEDYRTIIKLIYIPGLLEKFKFIFETSFTHILLVNQSTKLLNLLIEQLPILNEFYNLITEESESICLEFLDSNSKFRIRLVFAAIINKHFRVISTLLCKKIQCIHEIFKNEIIHFFQNFSAENSDILFYFMELYFFRLQSEEVEISLSESRNEIFNTIISSISSFDETLTTQRFFEFIVEAYLKYEESSPGSLKLRYSNFFVNKIASIKDKKYIENFEQFLCNHPESYSLFLFKERVKEYLSNKENSPPILNFENNTLAKSPQTTHSTSPYEVDEGCIIFQNSIDNNSPEIILEFCQYRPDYFEIFKQHVNTPIYSYLIKTNRLETIITLIHILHFNASTDVDFCNSIKILGNNLIDDFMIESLSNNNLGDIWTFFEIVTRIYIDNKDSDTALYFMDKLLQTRDRNLVHDYIIYLENSPFKEEVELLIDILRNDFGCYFGVEESKGSR